MDDEIPCWLPPLLLLKNYKGNWKNYIDAVHQYFFKDFVENRPFFERLLICVRYQPCFEEKGATFWHLISEGHQENERTPDLRRCERIRWPKPIIEKINSTDIRIWETFRPWKNQKQRRINFSIDNFSYLVVIAANHRGFDLVTAYPIEKANRREKLKKEFETFLRQKKEGSAV